VHGVQTGPTARGAHDNARMYAAQATKEKSVAETTADTMAELVHGVPSVSSVHESLRYRQLRLKLARISPGEMHRSSRSRLAGPIRGESVLSLHLVQAATRAWSIGFAGETSALPHTKLFVPRIESASIAPTLSSAASLPNSFSPNVRISVASIHTPRRPKLVSHSGLMLSVS
jgi:hypothetical protein